MKLLYYSGWTLIRTITKLVFRITVRGFEHFPQKGGFIVATNHISYCDPPMIGAWCPRQIYFLAKKELFRSKLFGALITAVNTLPVRRGAIDRKALETCIKTIDNGRGLLIFPEGTRSMDGRFLDPKPGIGMIARQAGCPIIPGYIHGSNRLGACFTGKATLTITYGEPLLAQWVSSVATGREGYHEIAEAVMARIAEIRDSVTEAKPMASTTD